MKIRIHERSNASDLEDVVNQWIELTKKKYVIKDIKYAIIPASSDSYYSNYSAMLILEEIE